MPQNAKQLKQRIRSVDSTMHITKAMELVASSKLRRATENMEASRPYFAALTEAMNQLSAAESEFTKQSKNARPCYIVIAGDRGLAGGYNNNVYKLLKAETDGKSACLVTIGKRVSEYAARRGYDIIKSYPSTENMTLADAAALGAELKDKFAKGEIDGLYVIFTKYHTMLSQEPTTKKLLPLDECEKPTRYTLFEPSSGAVLSAVIPEYISGMTYGAVCESFASELSARRTAMDSASKNAAEMIDALGLRYNRARQSAITQEITEIIGGSATS